MDNPLEQGRSLVDKVRAFVGIVQNSPAEVVTAGLALLFFSAAAVALENEFAKAVLPASTLKPLQIGCYTIGGCLAAWTAFKIWKQAIPPELPPPQIRPAAIKGATPFTEKDGEVFRGLGRKKELEHLLGYVLDDQVPLVVVMGESGVGKTSFLRAGLYDPLQKNNVRLIYWEALPTNPTDRLLHAIQSGWDAAKEGPAPKDLDEAIRALVASPIRTAIVLDQFEQLSLEAARHQPLFETLRGFVSSGLPPYRLSWVVAFRRDYDPSWRTLNSPSKDFIHRSFPCAFSITIRAG